MSSTGSVVFKKASTAGLAAHSREISVSRANMTKEKQCSDRKFRAPLSAAASAMVLLCSKAKRRAYYRRVLRAYPREMTTVAPKR